MDAKQLGDLRSVLATASGSARASSSVEAKLPLPVSQKWVQHACRTAGVARPRWNRHTCEWTTTGKRDDGALETITIRRGDTPTSIVIDVSWTLLEGAPADTATARKLVTSFVTGMLWSLRRTKLARLTFD